MMKKRFEVGDKVCCPKPTLWMKDHRIRANDIYEITAARYPDDWTDADARIRLKGIEYDWGVEYFCPAQKGASDGA